MPGALRSRLHAADAAADAAAHIVGSPQASIRHEHQHGGQAAGALVIQLLNKRLQHVAQCVQQVDMVAAQLAGNGVRAAAQRRCQSHKAFHVLLPAHGRMCGACAGNCVIGMQQSAATSSCAVIISCRPAAPPSRQPWAAQHAQRDEAAHAMAQQQRALAAVGGDGARDSRSDCVEIAAVVQRLQAEPPVVGRSKQVMAQPAIVGGSGSGSGSGTSASEPRVCCCLGSCANCCCHARTCSQAPAPGTLSAAHSRPCGT